MSENIKGHGGVVEVALRGNWCEASWQVVKDHWDTHSARDIAKMLNKRFPDRKFSKQAVIGRAWRCNLPNQGAAKRKQESTEFRGPALQLRQRRLADRAKAAAPVIKVLGNNQTFVQAEAAPPKVATDWATAYAPLPGSQPRPWLERRFGECTWPIEVGAETYSCCLPAVRFGWCEAHANRGRQPIPANRKNLVRNLRRYVS